MDFFATCARGLESVLAEEVRRLGAGEVEAGRGGVHFRGDRELLYLSNLWLRTAIRVLQRLFEASVESPEELYDAVSSVDWSEYLKPEQTLAVDCNVRDSKITHSHYAALKTKDAICDQFVRRYGRRPSVDRERPNVGLNLHIYRDQAVLSLDSSGDSLHKRGYRPILTRAPLNEALAAGLLQLAGYDGSGPLVDPLCGSGTLCIEGAWMALRRPPGLTRRWFGFMGWLDYDIGLWTDLRDEAREGVAKRLAAAISGSDIRSDAVGFAEKNARAAGVGNLLDFGVLDVSQFRAPAGEPGMIVCNPPYGERIGMKEVGKLHKTLGRVFGERCCSWRVFVFSGNKNAAEQIGLPVKWEVDLFNGRIPCKLIEFETENR